MSLRLFLNERAGIRTPDNLIKSQLISNATDGANTPLPALSLGHFWDI